MVAIVDVYFTLDCTVGMHWRSQPVRILSYYYYSFLQKFTVFTVNEHQKISKAELNCQAGFATVGMHYCKE